MRPALPVDLAAYTASGMPRQKEGIPPVIFGRYEELARALWALCPERRRPGSRHSARRFSCGSLIQLMSPLARIAPVIICLSLASACTTTSTAPSATGWPVVSPVVRRELGNGVRVVIQEHRTSDVVAVQLWVGA